MRHVNLSAFNNFGRTLYFGGGAHAPAQPAPPVLPPKAETPDNTAAQNAARKKGLQSTLLTGAMDQSTLGGSNTPLGASTQGTLGSPANAYGGEN